jgi:hypothetical protein
MGLFPVTYQDETRTARRSPALPASAVSLGHHPHPCIRRARSQRTLLRLQALVGQHRH